jgi:transcriptional regulator GlxA family with amidase domain
VQQIRFAKAREALELTRRPVEQIAWEVGYGDPSAFRKLFNRVTAAGGVSAKVWGGAGCAGGAGG